MRHAGNCLRPRWCAGYRCRRRDGAANRDLLKEQTARSLLDALALFERWEDTFSSDACRANALRFSVESFRRNMTAVIIDAVAEHIAARR